jgi:hypothetical protein
MTLILLASGKAVQACSCTGHPVCGPHRYRDADFVGEVISTERVEHIPPVDWPGILVRVRVLESFRGTPKIGEIIQIRTGVGGGDCGFKFIIGAKYLIDAYREKDDIFGTNICNLTAPIEQAEVELCVLRSIATGHKAPDLTGILSKNTGLTPDTFEEKPFPGIHVTFQPVAGGTAIESITDSFGSFTFPSLTSGTYHINLGLPDNFSPATTSFSGWLRDDQLPPLEIKKVKGKFAACHIEILTEASGSISGIIKVPDNKLVDWYVYAASVVANGESEHTVQETYADSNGVFHLLHLPMGRYSVQFISEKRSTDSEPQIVDLKDGEKKTGLILKAKEQH